MSIRDRVRAWFRSGNVESVESYSDFCERLRVEREKLQPDQSEFDRNLRQAEDRVYRTPWERRRMLRAIK